MIRPSFDIAMKKGAALVRLCGGLESPVDPSALSALAALPEHITGGVA